MMECGEQCVTVTGEEKMQKLCVDNLVTLVLVMQKDLGFTLS